MTKKRIATFDIETDGLLSEVTKVWCICIKDHEDERVSVFHVQGASGNGIRDGLRRLSEYDVLIGHNCIAFDFPVLRKLYGFEYEGTKCDTLLISRTQRPNRTAPKGSNAGPHSVESWGIRLGIDKVQNDVWTTFNPIILERCQQDVEIQYRMFHALIEEGRGEGWAACHRLNNQVFHYLQLQEERGWLIDRERLERHVATLTRWIDRIDRSISPRLPNLVEVKETKKSGEYNYVKKPFLKSGAYNNSVLRWYDADGGGVCGPFSRVLFRKVDLDSSKETKDYLLSQGWEPAEWNTDDEGEITSPKFSKDDTFEGIVSGVGRLIARRIQCKQRLGILNGWKDALDEYGRLHPLVSGIASTGRLRHSRVVNVPSPHSKAFFARQMREIFIAQPGWKLVGVDSKGNQMRQLCGRMKGLDGIGDVLFTDAVLTGSSDDGTDMHSLNQRRSGAPSRSRAKNFFYGCILFGAGDKKTAKVLECDIAKAKATKQKYFDEMPLLRQLLNSLREEWLATAQKWYDSKSGRWVFRNGYITGLDGRPILVESEHTLLCYALQSDEAIQMAKAYVLTHERARDAGYILGQDWNMLIWMHDEFQMECKPEIKEHLSKLACDAIKEAGEWFNIQCPHDGDYRIGSNWFETH